MHQIDRNLHTGNANLSLAHVIFLESSGIHWTLDKYPILTNNIERAFGYSLVSRLNRIGRSFSTPGKNKRKNNKSTSEFNPCLHMAWEAPWDFGWVMWLLNLLIDVTFGGALSGFSWLIWGQSEQLISELGDFRGVGGAEVGSEVGEFGSLVKSWIGGS